MSQVGHKPKTFSAHSARSIVLSPHSQSGVTTRYCDGLLSTFTSNCCP